MYLSKTIYNNPHIDKSIRIFPLTTFTHIPYTNTNIEMEKTALCPA